MYSTAHIASPSFFLAANQFPGIHFANTNLITAAGAYPQHYPSIVSNNAAALSQNISQYAIAMATSTAAASTGTNTMPPDFHAAQMAVSAAVGLWPGRQQQVESAKKNDVINVRPRLATIENGGAVSLLAAAAILAQNRSSVPSSTTLATQGGSPFNQQAMTAPGSAQPHICTREGCTSHSKARGLCIKHGAYGTCKTIGCSTNAQARGLCTKHGAKGICKIAGCSTNVQARGLCTKHGGGGKCSHNACTKSAAARGLCFEHGAFGRCRFVGCSVRAVNRKRLCSVHAANKACKTDGCPVTLKRRGYCTTCQVAMATQAEKV